MGVHELLQLVLCEAAFRAANIHAVFAEMDLFWHKVVFAGKTLRTAPVRIFRWDTGF